MKLHPFVRPLAIAACSIFLTAGIATTSAAAPQAAVAADAPTGFTGDPVDPDGVPSSERDEALGSSWKTDGDVATVVMGGSDGIAVLSAKSKTGYSWREVTTLPVSSQEADLWISNSCVTSSGKYTVVVYGPRMITNSEEGFGFGGTAVIVELATGKVRQLGTGYSIAYYNPGCGAGDTFTLTAHAPGVAGTLVASLDARTGDLIKKATVEQQATSSISAADGTIYSATPQGIVDVTSSGRPGTVATTTGVAYDLAVDKTGRLGYVTADGDTATVHVQTIGAAKVESNVVASGPLTEVGLRAARAGGFFVLGGKVKLTQTDAGLVSLPEASAHSVISSTGHLVIDAVKPAGIAAATMTDPTELQAEIGATATVSNQQLDFSLGDYAPASELVEAKAPRAPFGSARAVTSGDPHDPGEAERYCAVSRNDVNNQAYQPKPRQVEWAVDRAVKGQLTETRVADYRGNAGITSYTAQGASGLFPLVPLQGGGTIPPQVVLGVLMQESNLWQASKFTAPANTGNPLIGNYYGNSSNIWSISYILADCGYGVGQITDGMRIAGHTKPGETALPVKQQRAIAVDYVANIAKSVNMLSQKWNQLKNLGITINNGSPSSIENWFATVWAYNTGIQPSSASYGNPTGCSPSPTCTTDYGTWGLGWSNNPANPEYPVNRIAFLDYDHAVDAANPQNWPYPEKVMGFAAWGLSLVETQGADAASRTYPVKMVASYTLAWWNADFYRSMLKPPPTTFCSTLNGCSTTLASPCTIPSLYCYWHGNATWKDCTTTGAECGYGSERFADASYHTEITSMNNPALPADTVRSSFVPDCAPPPASMLVVDDTTHVTARNGTDCAMQSRAPGSSFAFTFQHADANGGYPAKVDLHQQGGGFNGHFWFAHVRATGEPEGKVTGVWSLGQTLTNKWTRVWIHMPDYAGWTDAAYTITYAPGLSETRYLPQRRFANQWVPIGVFKVNGAPTVTMSNVGSFNSAHDDVAWDAVGFQQLNAKPADFVVGLGDSFSSGEGAGSYQPWSDHDGSSTTPGQAERNACHQSANSWLLKSVLPGPITGTLASRVSPVPNVNLDYHFLACSGAESENLLPVLTADPADEGSVLATNKNRNGENQPGVGQYGMPSQLDAGYLDANTTLVTLSIGGNDMRFAKIIGECWTGGQEIPGLPAACATGTLSGDTMNAQDASTMRLTTQLNISLDHVLYQITKRAPNARVVLMGYPKLFETGGFCVGMAPSNITWLNQVSTDLTQALHDAVDRAVLAGKRVTFADPQPYFHLHNLCEPGSALNGLMPFPGDKTPGDLPTGMPGLYSSPVSAQSAHPNTLGTTNYSDALEAALAGNYP
ncbi:MAG: hydrolase family protein [Schumannella sp.]|nr:hydrolase family protein [Schumannella sp.]